MRWWRKQQGRAEGEEEDELLSAMRCAGTEVQDEYFHAVRGSSGGGVVEVVVVVVSVLV